MLCWYDIFLLYFLLCGYDWPRILWRMGWAWIHSSLSSVTQVLVCITMATQVLELQACIITWAPRCWGCRHASLHLMMLTFLSMFLYGLKTCNFSSCFYNVISFPETLPLFLTSLRNYPLEWQHLQALFRKKQWISSLLLLTFPAYWLLVYSVVKGQVIEERVAAF